MQVRLAVGMETRRGKRAKHPTLYAPQTARPHSAQSAWSGALESGSPSISTRPTRKIPSWLSPHPSQTTVDGAMLVAATSTHRRHRRIYFRHDAAHQRHGRQPLILGRRRSQLGRQHTATWIRPGAGLLDSVAFGAQACHGWWGHDLPADQHRGVDAQRARQGRKALGSALTPAGALPRAVSALRAGVLMPMPGVLLKSANRNAAGALAPTGVLTALRAVLPVLVGTLTPAGGVLRSVWTRWTGAVTPAGVCLRRAAKVRQARWPRLGRWREALPGHGRGTDAIRRWRPSRCCCACLWVRLRRRGR